MRDKLRYGFWSISSIHGLSSLVVAKPTHNCSTGPCWPRSSICSFLSVSSSSVSSLSLLVNSEHESLDQMMSAATTETVADTQKAERIPLVAAMTDMMSVPAHTPVHVTRRADVATNDCICSGASRCRSITIAVKNTQLA